MVQINSIAISGTTALSCLPLLYKYMAEIVQNTLNRPHARNHTQNKDS